ncbi:MAG TPA: AAA family ATPase [Solirubrobacterales bacterium]|nr:AAA family ATPase [Solirubrobacterales bacterium]
MANPEITLCGRLSVRWDGEQLEANLPGRQGRLLFSYLVLNRSHPVRRDELVEALWADEGLPSGGEALLAPPLSRLRKTLGPGRLEGRAELSLSLGQEARIDWEVAQDALDATRESLEAGDAESAWDLAIRAEEIFGGGLLPGLESRWIDEHRAHLEEMRLRSLEAVAGAGVRLGPAELARAERSARTAVEASPFRESARAALIEVMRAQGNIAEALRSYEELRILLREELGTFPAPELTALHEQLLNAHEHANGAAGVPVSDRRDTDGQKPTIEIGELIDPRIRAIEMVGRGETLDRLRTELERAASGELRIALMSGEGGVGKTRLAAELAASRDDVTVLYGRCEPDEIRPFRIWSGLLRTAMEQIDETDLFTVVGADGPVLSRILPELVRGMDVPPGPPADLESERQALFSSVLRMIGRLTAIKPMLIILDDLHWADRSTLLLLSSLAGDDPPKGVLALGIYRDTELPESSPLLETVANLQRHLPTARLKVDALDPEAVRHLIRGRIDENLAAALHDQTGGNPFFIEQIVRHLEETGQSDPATVPVEVREIIGRRVSRLPEGGPELLQRAALIGRDFDLDILIATTGEDEDRVIELLDSAVLAGLLDESPTIPGRYSFVHALLRSTLSRELSLTRRTQVHRNIGEAIEQRYRNRPDKMIGELAWHFGQAGPAESDRAVLYATRAGEQAEERLAYVEAVGFYEDAITACRSDEPVDLSVLAGLLLSQAEAEWRMGDLQRAGDTFFEAADAARESGVPELLARAAVGTNWGSWEAFDVDRNQHLALLQEALDAIGPKDGPLRAQLMAFLGHALYLGGTSTERAREMMLDARDMVRRLDDPATEFRVLSATVMLIWEPENRQDRFAYTLRMVELAETTDDPEDKTEALAWRSVVAFNLGLRDQMDSDQARRAHVSRNLPQTKVATAAMQAVRCFLEGHWLEGERLVNGSIASGIPQSAAVASFDTLLFMVRALQGGLGDHVERLREKAEMTDDWETWPVWRLGLLLGMIHAGQIDEARRELELPGRDGLDGYGGRHVTKLPYCGMATMLFFELDDAERAGQLAELMMPWTGEWTIFGPTGGTYGPVDLLLGEMLIVSGRDAEAIEPLEAAIEMCLQMDSLPYLARAQLGLADVLKRTGADRERASELHESGKATALELGMRPVLDRYTQ